jgi:hypothetical protein
MALLARSPVPDDDDHLQPRSHSAGHGTRWRLMMRRARH